MRFHPDKCKVLSVSYKKVPWIDILPFAKFSYELQNSILDYVDNERDLGVLIHDTLNWELHHNKITSKASQLLGLTKRTCHFINNNFRRSLYLALVRSQFELCSPIWRPISSFQLEKFEKIQKMR